MEIIPSKTAATLILTLSGRLDTVTAPLLQDALKKDLHDITLLQFDLTKLEYISSAGLRVFLMAQKQMNGKGKMELLHVNEAVLQILEISGFTDILTIIQ
ncbi:STAS domain-containing protein [Pectinatus brassicae]|uniref:Anti-sigma factor antagonist n=1 Tax=Pectinatus brassicae TaxID=862415 RepID=A0A840UQ23_9FIRM|nr:STAS domain-containing protein [Pectinatus brassicae]MBB5336292.1 anti-sigma B factor antagonist [Pectinatus brassicae]